jgi:ABC-type phosphate transport system substrate-binding protein
MVSRSADIFFGLHRHRWLGLLLSVAAMLCLGHDAKPVLAADLTPQIYEANGYAASLSHETLREIFFMRLTAWPDGTPIRVFVLPDKHPLHIRFSKDILGVYPFQLRAAWDRLVYSGTGMAPTTVETVEEMRKRIQNTPGGIGYVNR